MKNMNQISDKFLLSSFYRSVFDTTPVGQLVIKSDATLLAANREMFRYFKKNPVNVEGCLFGNLFKCKSVYKNGITCGSSDKCGGCKIRDGIQSILYNDSKIEGIVFRHEFVVRNAVTEKWFSFSGKPMMYDKNRFAVVTMCDITEQQQSVIRLEKKLELDLATGVKNKYSIMDIIAESINQLTEGNYFYICMVDFDNFKEINDRYGHLMGDRVLSAFSDFVRRNIMSGDVVGRYGGEEFIILFKNSGQEEAISALRNIHAELYSAFACLVEQPVTFSGGLLFIDEKYRRHPQPSFIVGQVDKLLYRAKKSGRNRLVTLSGEFPFPDYIVQK